MHPPSFSLAHTPPILHLAAPACPYSPHLQPCLNTSHLAIPPRFEHTHTQNPPPIFVFQQRCGPNMCVHLTPRRPPYSSLPPVFVFPNTHPSVIPQLAGPAPCARRHLETNRPGPPLPILAALHIMGGHTRKPHPISHLAAPACHALTPFSPFWSPVKFDLGTQSHTRKHLPLPHTLPARAYYTRAHAHLCPSLPADLIPIRARLSLCCLACITRHPSLLCS